MTLNFLGSVGSNLLGLNLIFLGPVGSNLLGIGWIQSYWDRLDPILLGSVGSNLLGIVWIQSSWVGPNLLGIGFSQSSGDQLYPIFLGLGTPGHSWEQPVPNTTHIFDFVQHVRVECTLFNIDKLLHIHI